MEAIDYVVLGTELLGFLSVVGFFIYLHNAPEAKEKRRLKAYRKLNARR